MSHEEKTPDPKPTDTLAARAARWMSENPRAMQLFRGFADDAYRAGRRIGIAALTERVRWECAITLNGDDVFRINNNHRAYIARRLIEERPELAETFELRAVGL